MENKVKGNARIRKKRREGEEEEGGGGGGGGVRREGGGRGWGRWLDTAVWTCIAVPFFHIPFHKWPHMSVVITLPEETAPCSLLLHHACPRHQGYSETYVPQECKYEIAACTDMLPQWHVPFIQAANSFDINIFM